MSETQVVVLGGGMSGLTAALSAADAGAAVTLLERAPTIGGSMALSGGGIWAPRDFEMARRYIPKGDPGLQRLLVDELPALWAWYEGHGLPLSPEMPCMKDNFGRLRLMALGEIGRREPFAEAMAKLAEAAGADIRTSVEVHELVREDDRWQLVTGSESIEADAVVFATGGFQNNLDMLRRYVTPEAEKLIVRSNRWSNGLAIRLLAPHGAALSRGLSSFYGHTLPHTDREILRDDFLRASQYYTDYSILLNQLGLRFTDESVGVVDEFNAQQGSRQPDARYWIVFDEAIRTERVLTVGLAGINQADPENPLTVAESLGACLLRAETIEDLARQLGERGLPSENVLDSIQTFNAAEDPVGGLYPPRQRYHQPLVVPPYYALECVGAITYTMGGMSIDTSCRVQRRAGGHLAGIYAAGADAGGVFQDVYAGGLAWAGITGRIAGVNAAER